MDSYTAVLLSISQSAPSTPAGPSCRDSWPKIGILEPDWFFFQSLSVLTYPDPQSQCQRKVWHTGIPGESQILALWLPLSAHSLEGNTGHCHTPELKRAQVILHLTADCGMGWAARDTHWNIALKYWNTERHSYTNWNVSKKKKSHQ